MDQHRSWSVPKVLPTTPWQEVRHDQGESAGRHSLGLVVVWLLAATPARAQSVAGSQLSGVVRDASGAAVPGAEVRSPRPTPGRRGRRRAHADGSYAFPNLPVGPYELKVTLQGFNTYVQSGIVLQVSTNPVVNVTLNVGTLGETVTVVGNATMVETQSTGVGQVIDHQRVTELPLNGRQVTELIFLSGLAASAPPADLNTNKNFPTTTISVAGGQANGISFIMDGATHNDPFNNLNLPTPFPDAIQEFKVETSALPARYGHHAASTVNVVTQSGSNKVTADVFEFLRNYRFNARNFFAPARDSLNRNQFGGTLGAPIVKNRLFFFGGYQGRIERSNPVDALAYVPTQAMRNGDFTAFASPACNGGRQVNLGAPFVNNRVDPSRLNNVALNFLQYVPVATDPCGALRYGIPNNNTEHQGIAKLDYTINARAERLRALLLRGLRQPRDLRRRERPHPVSSGPEQPGALGRAGAHNWALSPTTFNSLHVTFNRTLNDRALPEYFTPTELGSNITSPYPGYTGVTVTGNGFSVGFGAVNPGYFHSKSFQVADDLDFIRGKHQLSIGANWIHTSIETSNNRPTNGAFTFNGQTTGLSLADFMVGSISGGFLQGNPVFDYDNHDYIAAYVQDSWRVRPNLLLNLGLRWEPFRPIQNTYGWVSHFDQAAFDQGTAQHGLPAGSAPA